MEVNKWIKERPNKPCVFLTRNKFESENYNYDVWMIDWVESDDGLYLGLMQGDGEEWGDLDDLLDSEYFIIGV